MGDRFVKLDGNRNILSVDATNNYSHSMSQMLTYDEIEIGHGHPDLYITKFEEILITGDDSDIGYFIEVDLKYPNNIKEKTKVFPFCPENKICIKTGFRDYMKNIKRDT